MEKPKGQKRIIFRIDKELYESFQQKARELCIPMSKLLVKWLKEVENVNIKHIDNNHPKSKVFNFYVDLETYENFNDYTSEKDLTVSAFLNSVVDFKINKLSSIDNFNTQPSNDTEPHLDLYDSGNLDDLKQHISSNFQALSIDALLKYAMALIEISDFGIAKALIEQAKYLSKSNSRQLEVEALANLLQCRIDIINYEIKSAYYNLDNAFNLGNLLKNNLILGRCHLASGILASLSGNIDLSLEEYNKSLDLLDVHPKADTVGEIFLRMSISYNFKLDLEKEYYYLKKAEERLILNPNLVIKGSILHQHAIINLQKGNFAQALNYSNKAVLVKKMSGNVHKLVYSYEVQSQCHLQTGNIQSLKNCLHIADNLSHRATPRRELTIKNIIKSIYEASYQSEKSINYLHKLKNMSIQNNIKTDVYSYYYYAYQYIYLDEKQRSDALVKLRELKYEGNYAHIRECASKTIETRAFSFAC